MAKSTPKKYPALVQRKDLLMVPFSLTFVRPDFNLREDYEITEDFLTSIRKKVLDPLEGFKEGNKYCVTEGHRRHRAAGIIYQRYGEDILLPIRPEPKGTNDKDRHVAMLLRNGDTGQKRFNVLERALGVARLRDQHKMTAAQIAKDLAQSETYIGSLLRLADGPDEAKALIRTGHLQATYAMELIKKGEIESFIKDVKEGKYDKGIDQVDLFAEPSRPAPSVVAKEPMLALPAPDETVEADIPVPPRAKQATITKKDVESGGRKKQPGEVNSWSEVRKWLKVSESENIHPEKKKLYAFLGRLNSNEYTQEGLAKYFSSK